MFPLPQPLRLELALGALLLAGAAVTAGYTAWDHKVRKEERALCEAAHLKADQAEAERRAQAKQENDLETQRIANRDRANAVSLAVASVGLRNAGAQAIGRLQHPAPVAGSASAPDSSGVPALVSGEVEATLREMAAVADDSRRAGLACEAAYQSLTR